MTLGGDDDNTEQAMAAFADDSDLAGVVALVPAPDVWDRLADHHQRANFDVREPVGVEPIQTSAELAAAGASTTMVLVTGHQRITFDQPDGTSQTQTVHPSLQMLIGCADEWSGCRVLRVVDRQP
ncbi:hypothetical protein G1H11_21775 [Phytoactinopolyspora alkaliphila]|uniref:Uncharacterized protein n=1 Tax=Phytoactinopolyspora alkaliphila TaxID=1783498 RepID=A0A6N9YSH4_9ACTN|nr:hypothetical protein [Phytoactinopolyspora alkaliphila]NED97932.1 hypothetical protein [Phytoactinopolyspora alkaliphila]